MTASQEPTAAPPKHIPPTRRALLAGALGGIGAMAAAAIGRASPTRAVNGETVTVGNSFIGSTTTQISSNVSGGAAIRGVNGSGSGQGVTGMATNGGGGYGLYGQANGTSGTGTLGIALAASGITRGVYGQSNSTSGEAVFGFATATSGANIGVDGRANGPSGLGVRGLGPADSTGVLGHSGGITPPAARAKTGVYGHAAQDGGSRGVWGQSTAGQGVRGQASSGVGVYGKAGSGYAIRGSGRLRFDKVSGVATIPAGSTGVTVSPGVNVSSGSFVLLTPKTNIGSRGLWFTTNASANTFRIRMSSSRGSNTKVAWLLLG